MTLLEQGFKHQQSNQENSFRKKYGDGPSYNVKNGKLVPVHPESSDSSMSEEEEEHLSTIPNEPTQDNNETLDNFFGEPLLITMTEADQKGLAKLVAKEVAEIIGVWHRTKNFVNIFRLPDRIENFMTPCFMTKS